RPDQQVSGCCQVSPFACTSASSGHGAPLSVLVDDSDSDQILAIEELRSLRDRTGDYAPRPEAVTSAAPIQAPDPSAGIPLDAGADPWEDLRRRASDRRRWGRLVAAGGCFVLTGGAVAMLIITAHLRSGRPATVEVPVPAVSAPPVTPPAPLLRPRLSRGRLQCPQPAPLTAPSRLVAVRLRPLDTRRRQCPRQGRPAQARNALVLRATRPDRPGRTVARDALNPRSPEPPPPGPQPRRRDVSSDHRLRLPTR